MKKKYRYDCISPKSEEELECIIANSREIPFKVFMENVNEDGMRELEKGFRFPLMDGQDASFHKSVTPMGKEVYFFRRSAIEYIFY